DLSDIPGIKVDKHSTGGVGDKTSLIIAPIAASYGVPIAKMSGRGLGFTGGTVDKMESIPGFRTSLSQDEFVNQVKEAGIAIIGQTSEVAPADKKLYALRDVTATVGNVGLITSSIMSKKLASGSDAILLDVKCGDGSFMKTEEAASELAALMVKVGTMAGKRMAAIISDMGSPLGYAVGNSLEIIEVMETLKGYGPKDLVEIAMVLAGGMIYLGGKAESFEEGKKMAEAAIENGQALEKFREFVKAQGGNPDIVDDYTLLPEATFSVPVEADRDGYVANLFAEKTGLASQQAGAGRATKEEKIDMAAGIYLGKKPGDEVRRGDYLAMVYGNNIAKVKAAAASLKEAFVISDEIPEKQPLIKKTIGL
ncbi:MAG: thymidine phosphorylase, partial [Firmicutes bacterium]|nr:thymidine phosphorylase [Bacillota bacterium]